MFKIQGQVERETEKAYLFRATVLFTSSSVKIPYDSAVSVWFPKSRVEKVDGEFMYFEHSNEWLLSAKEREAQNQFVFTTFKAQ